MSSHKKLTCEGTLRQVFIRIYRLEIQSVMLVLLTQLLWTIAPLPSLWFNSPPSLLACVNKYTVYLGYGVLGLRQINTWRKIPFQVIFLDYDILHRLLWVLSFYGAICMDWRATISYVYSENDFPSIHWRTWFLAPMKRGFVIFLFFYFFIFFIFFFFFFWS